MYKFRGIKLYMHLKMGMCIVDVIRSIEITHPHSLIRVFTGQSQDYLNLSLAHTYNRFLRKPAFCVSTFWHCIISRNTTVYRRNGSYRFKTAFPELYPLQKKSLFAENKTWGKEGL